jgi:hypothetical protein
MQPGSNFSCFFIKVHAMTSIFAASFTRIFVLIPFSRSLALEEHSGQTCPSEQDPPAEGYWRDCFILRYLLFKRA